LPGRQPVDPEAGDTPAGKDTTVNISASDLRELLATAPAQPAPTELSHTEPLVAPGTLCIVVMQRGWVAVGKLYQTGDVCTLAEAKVIRRWGATQGLGQLAAQGPQENTVLDPAPYGIIVHALAIVGIFLCNAGAWEAQG
jgi:hypothetical protein